MRDGARLPFIAHRASVLYRRIGMLRILSSLLIAFALLLTPFTMIGGSSAEAHAAMPQGASAASHCMDEGKAAPASDKHGPGMKAGCAIACAAMPAAGPVPGEQLPPQAISPVSLSQQSLAGIQPEGETPPPRITPEI